MGTPIVLQADRPDVIMPDKVATEFTLDQDKIDTIRFQVDPAYGPVAVCFYGMEGTPLKVQHEVEFKDCSTFTTDYPKDAPYTFAEDGCAAVFFKPGWYQVVTLDGTDLPDTVRVSVHSITPEYATAWREAGGLVT